MKEQTMKINSMMLMAFLALYSCQRSPKPDQEPPYEWVTQTISPVEFGFNDEIGGVGIDDGILKLWQAKSGTKGLAWYSWNDSGESILGIRARKSKPNAHPKLVININDERLFEIVPDDTSGYFSSQLFILKPSFIIVLFEPDEKFKSEVEIEWMKVTTKKLKKENL